MALMKTTTNPRPRPKPSASVLIVSTDELDDEAGKLGGGLVWDGTCVVEVELVDIDVDDAELDVIVVGLMLPKRDDAMADISGSAAA